MSKFKEELVQARRDWMIYNKLYRIGENNSDWLKVKMNEAEARAKAAKMVLLNKELREYLSTSK